MNTYLNEINELFKLVGPLGDLSQIDKKTVVNTNLEKNSLIISYNYNKNTKFAWFIDFCNKNRDLQQLFTTCLDDLESIYSICQAQRDEFKRIQDKYNLLSHNISQLQEIVSGFERHYGHYRRFNVLTRILDDLDCSKKDKAFLSDSHLQHIAHLFSMSNPEKVESDNFSIFSNISDNSNITDDSYEFITAAGKIATELAKIIYCSQDSIDFFLLHPNYIQSPQYQDYYKDLLNRAFDLSTCLFREVYSRLEFKYNEDLTLDISKHFIQYKVSAQRLRPLLDILVEKTKLGNEVYENHLDQLQLYYVAMRIKNLHVIFEIFVETNEHEKAEALQEAIAFIINLSKLEITFFSITFGDSGFQRLKGVIYSLAVSFTEYFKSHLDSISDKKALCTVIDSFINQPIPESLLNCDPFGPILRCFEDFKTTLRSKLVLSLDGKIKSLLDKKVGQTSFPLSIDVINLLSDNYNRLDINYIILKLSELIKFIIEIDYKMEFDGILFIIKNLYCIKDRINKKSILEKLKIDTILEEQLFKFSYEFTEKFIPEPSKILDQLHKGIFNSSSIDEEFNKTLINNLETHLPSLYKRLSEFLSDNYKGNKKLLNVRVNDIYFTLIAHISDLQGMVQDLLPSDCNIVIPKHIQTIAKRYSIFD